MTNVIEMMEARRNGCHPFWWPPYDAYCCGCEDELHRCDEKSIVITKESAARRREEARAD